MRKTPWVFTDELEWAQLSRSIAETGHAARRGEPIFFKSLYAVPDRPGWWIDSTAAAYAAIKYLNAIVMSLGRVPDLPPRADARLATRGVADRRARAIVIPALSTRAVLLPEVLAYPVRALLAG